MQTKLSLYIAVITIFSGSLYASSLKDALISESKAFTNSTLVFEVTRKGEPNEVMLKSAQRLQQKILQKNSKNSENLKKSFVAQNKALKEGFLEKSKVVIKQGEKGNFIIEKITELEAGDKIITSTHKFYHAGNGVVFLEKLPEKEVTVKEYDPASIMGIWAAIPHLYILNHDLDEDIIKRGLLELKNEKNNIIMNFDDKNILNDLLVMSSSGRKKYKVNFDEKSDVGFTAFSKILLTKYFGDDVDYSEVWKLLSWEKDQKHSQEQFIYKMKLNYVVHDHTGGNKETFRMDNVILDK